MAIITGGKVIEGALSRLGFRSVEQTGTGAAQSIAHGLGVTPTSVAVVATDTAPATVGVFTVIYGVHTVTNAVVTVTSGKKYIVLAWA